MKKILIADDDRAILTLLSYNFRQNDYEVTIVSDGKKAYDKARKNPFDLLLLDLMMPEYSGIEVTQKLRAEVRVSKLAVALAGNPLRQLPRLSPFSPALRLTRF